MIHSKASPWSGDVLAGVCAVLARCWRVCAASVTTQVIGFRDTRGRVSLTTQKRSQPVPHKSTMFTLLDDALAEVRPKLMLLVDDPCPHDERLRPEH